MVQEQHRNRSSWRSLITLGFLLAAIAFSPGIVASVEPLPVHGAVAAWIEEHPGEPVPLIIQHDGTPDDLLAFVEDSGGIIEQEFQIIPAIDVELPGGFVDALARQGDVTWVSLDAPVQSTGLDAEEMEEALSQVYPLAIDAPGAWETATGKDVTVALIDTGVSDDAKEDFFDGSGDLRIQWVSARPSLDPDEDGFGHGTHIGGIIAGYSTTTDPTGKYTGIAPEASLLSVRIADDDGSATIGDLMAGLEWVDENRDAYNIQVLNLSVTSTVAQSYTVDPIDAAVELLWFRGIVVVVAAGNEGDAQDAVHYPPANDPFVITVGAFDDQGTPPLRDDALASWSSRGLTQDGFAKPEVLAPGVNIIAPVSPNSYLARTYPQHVVERHNQAYFRMSGTSMAAGVVSGLAALVLQAHPTWTPGEVKAVLLKTSRSMGKHRGAVRADDAVEFTRQPDSADDGLMPSYLLLAAAGVDEADFEDMVWRDAIFDGIRWGGLELNGIRWGSVDWNGIRWGSVSFDGIRWGGLGFEGIRWGGIRWGGRLEE